MTKQPDPSRPSTPRSGSVVPSPVGSSEPPSVVPRLKTVTPQLRGTNSDPQDEHKFPNVLRRRRDPASPFAIGGVTNRPVDVDLVRQGIGSTENSDQPTPMTIRERIDRIRHPFSSVLISTSIHLAIFLTLAIMALGTQKPKPQISVVATIDSTPVPEELDQTDLEMVTIENTVAEKSPIDMKFDQTSVDDNINAAESEAVSPNLVNNDTNPTPAENLQPVVNGNLPTGGGLEGRGPVARAQLAGKLGGTRESEMAVELGLKWIVAHQRKDGSWRFFHDDGKCNGACGNEGTNEASTAATGLALMSLLGAGYTHRTGPYQKEVKQGIDFLISKIRVSVRGGSLVSGNKGMYAHAIATIALSEALAMTGDSLLVNYVQQARKYIEIAQHKAGGWRYDPGEIGDMTVTGWQLMALKSCEMSGFETGMVTYQLAEEFVDSMASTSGCYGYQAPGENPTTTAVGILSKMYLGADLKHGGLEKGTRFLADHGPSKHDVYFNYYATQVLHHRHDPDWPKWNQEMRDYLVNTQDQSGTHRAGSWFFADPHGQVGGRLYTTAMSVMILEVYYRYLPLYDEDALNSIN